MRLHWWFIKNGWKWHQKLMVANRSFRQQKKKLEISSSMCDSFTLIKPLLVSLIVVTAWQWRQQLCFVVNSENVYRHIITDMFVYSGKKGKANERERTGWRWKMYECAPQHYWSAKFSYKSRVSLLGTKTKANWKISPHSNWTVGSDQTWNLQVNI